MDAKIMELEHLSIDGEPQEHTFKEGYWKAVKKQKYMVRQDNCTKCGLERHMIKSEYTAEEGEVVMYWRSHTSHPKDNIPLCWGALNP